VHSRAASTPSSRGLPVGAAPVPDAVPGRRQPAPGEVGGQMALRRGQHVDHERAVGANRLEGAARAVEAHEHQRRVKRERGYRAGGGADRLAIRADTDLTIILWSIRGVIETTRGAAPDAWRRHLDILIAGLRSGPAPLAHQPLSQDNLDRVIAQA
jgi:hypothetical protein